MRRPVSDSGAHADRRSGLPQLLGDCSFASRRNAENFSKSLRSMSSRTAFNSASLRRRRAPASCASLPTDTRTSAITSDARITFYRFLAHAFREAGSSPHGVLLDERTAHPHSKVWSGSAPTLVCFERRGLRLCAGIVESLDPRAIKRTVLLFSSSILHRNKADFSSCCDV